MMLSLSCVLPQSIIYIYECLCAESCELCYDLFYMNDLDKLQHIIRAFQVFFGSSNHLLHRPLSERQETEILEVAEVLGIGGYRLPA